MYVQYMLRTIAVVAHFPADGDVLALSLGHDLLLQDGGQQRIQLLLHACSYIHTYIHTYIYICIHVHF